MLRKLKSATRDGFGAERRQVGAFVRQANQYRDAGRWRDAAADYRLALELDPAAFAIWVQLGHVLKEAKDHPGAMAAYQRARALDESDHDLHLHIGHLHAVSGHPARARQHYAQAASLGSTDPHAVRAMSIPASADELFREGDAQRDARAWAEAATAYQRGLELVPHAFDMWVQLGHVCKEMGAAERAEAAYSRAQALRWDDADLNVQLGHFYATGGDIARAADFYARAVSLGSRDHHALTFLGQRAGGTRSLQIVLSRLVGDERRKQAILSAPYTPCSFARFVLRNAT